MLSSIVCCARKQEMIFEEKEMAVVDLGNNR